MARRWPTLEVRAPSLGDPLAALEGLGWFDGLPPGLAASSREQVRAALGRKAGLADALALVTGDSECVSGDGDYGEVLRDVQRQTAGVFHATAVKEAWSQDAVLLSFRCGERTHETMLENLGDWLDGSLFDALNEALAGAGSELRLCELPALDQLYRYALVRPQAFEAAVKLGLLSGVASRGGAPATTGLSVKGSALCAAFSPEGSLLAVAGERVTVFDLVRGERAAELALGPRLDSIGHDTRARALLFSRDAEQVVAVCDDGAVRAWRWRATEPARVTRVAERGLEAACETPAGRRVVVARERVRVWEPDGALRTFELGFPIASLAAWGEVLALGGEALELWDAARGERLECLLPSSDRRRVKGLQVLADGVRLVAWEHDDVRVFDLRARTQLARFALPRESAATIGALLPGDRLLLGLHDGSLVAHALPDGQVCWRTSFGAGAWRSLTVSPDGRTLASVFDEGAHDSLLFARPRRSSRVQVHELPGERR